DDKACFILTFWQTCSPAGGEPDQLRLRGGPLWKTSHVIYPSDSRMGKPFCLEASRLTPSTHLITATWSLHFVPRGIAPAGFSFT
ncbi:hypothetical protein F7725_007918, partial [Dissostichus mawsoni]